LLLQEYRISGPTTLATISKDLGVSESHLKEQNKWTSNGKIPGDRAYTVTYIQQGSAPNKPVLVSNERDGTYTLPTHHSTQEFPKITGNKNLEDKPGQIMVNGIKGILATRNASQEEFSAQTATRKRKIRRVNDLKKSDKIKAGNYYYTKRKKGKAQVEEHVVKPGETLWEISQIYGIRLHSLKAKNRIYKDADLKTGMILKLQEYRKRNERIAYERMSPLRTGNTSNFQEAEKIAHTPPSTPISTPSPANSSIQTKTKDINHPVKAGDTLYAISRKYQVTIDQLKEWNQLNNNNLSIGQVLIIKK
jgi:membrane-bound lytic murein transglycosylase D